MFNNTNWDNKNWRRYNYMLLPTVSPHKEVLLKDISSIFKNSRTFILRYTTKFDCGYKTEWWYVILDKKIELSNVKKKYRYQIKRGIDHTIVSIIEIEKYIEEMFELYKNNITKRIRGIKVSMEKFIEMLNDNDNIEVWAVFEKNTSEMLSFAIVEVYEDYINLRQIYFNQQYHKINISSSLIYYICNYYLSNDNIKYICDGERSINHFSNFQEYLIKTFEFRKAYCHLNIIYRSKIIEYLINILSKYKEVVYRYSTRPGIINNIASLIKQERIYKTFQLSDKDN